MLNRLGERARESRPLTWREKQQLKRDYEVLGPTTLARLMNRSVESVKQHWKRLKNEEPIAA